MKAHFFRNASLVLIVAIAVAAAAGYYGLTAQLPSPLIKLLLMHIQLPPGFAIHVYATGVPNARSMTLGARGTVFVGSRRAGKVYALVPGRREDKAGEVVTIARDLEMPNGVAFHEGALFVGGVSRILRYDDIEARLKSPPAPVEISKGFPTKLHHASRYIRFGPDGWLYVSVGAPCNVCELNDERFATIMRMKPDGSGLEVFARGVRNSVGFDWQPLSDELWFTDNGRDGMGDNVPPDELNYAPRNGMNFGFPYCHGTTIADPEFGQNHSCREYVPPALELPAHVAALGMRFYTGEMFPDSYHDQIFIAEHGSWDRSVPTGYRVSLARFDGGQSAKYEPFAQGWLIGRFHWGRPVDVLVMSDGALLVSDDEAGAIYRISYENQ